MDVSALVFIDDTGYHFADFPTFLEAVKSDYRSIYGADIYLESDSQDGQIVAIQAKALYDIAALGASTFNSFSPATGQGIGLSRNVKINGISRRIATNSTADLTVVGQSGTVILNGIAEDTLGQKWDLPSPTTIPIGGSVIVTATAEVMGRVSAAAGTISKIFTPTLGWQTVTNVADATEGVPIESDAELRIRQALSTANPSLTVFEGSIGAVANVEGVTQVRGYENDTNTTDANGILPHSISHMVVGGDAMEIAQTIQRHKTPGTGTVGTTSETVFDSHGMPLLIKFTRPDEATVSVRLTITSGVGWTTDYERLISKAVANVINGFGIGNIVLLTKLFSPAYLVGTVEQLGLEEADAQTIISAQGTYVITLIELKKNAGAFAAANVSIDFDEYPSCDPDTNFTYLVS